MAKASAAKRRQRPHRRERERRSAPPLGRYDGVPVYDATQVQTVDLVQGPPGAAERLDSRVLLGIGPEGGRPVAYVLLCPCEGVRGLVSDLQGVAAVACEHHPPHEDRYSGSWVPDIAA